MFSFELYQWILFVLVIGCAAFIQRVSGFGLGIFAMLFLPHFLPSHTAAAAMICLISSVTSGLNAIRYRKEIPFRTILPMFGAALVMIPIAVRCAVYVPEAFLKNVLGVVLIGLSIYFLFFNEKIRIRATIRNGILAGSLSGFLNALFATGGPPAVLYLTVATTGNLAYFAGIQCYFSMVNVYSTLVRLFNGILTWEIVIASLVGLAGALVGDAIGRKLFDRLDARRLKQIIYIGMIISGALMIV